MQWRHEGWEQRWRPWGPTHKSRPFTALGIRIPTVVRTYVLLLGTKKSLWCMRDLPDWSDLLSQPSGTSLPLIAIPMSQAYDGCAWELQQISDGSALGNNLWKQLKKEKRKKKKKKTSTTLSGCNPARGVRQPFPSFYLSWPIKSSEDNQLRCLPCAVQHRDGFSLEMEVGSRNQAFFRPGLEKVEKLHRRHR